jgi:hypothetical protein
LVERRPKLRRAIGRVSYRSETTEEDETSVEEDETTVEDESTGGIVTMRTKIGLLTRLEKMNE